MKDKSEFPLLLKIGAEFLLQICLQLLAEGSRYMSARLKNLLLKVSSPADTFKLQLNHSYTSFCFRCFSC